MSRAGIFQSGLSEPYPMIFTQHGTDSVAINSAEKFSFRKWHDFYISVVRLGLPLNTYSIQEDAGQDRAGIYGLIFLVFMV